MHFFHSAFIGSPDKCLAPILSWPYRPLACFALRPAVRRVGAIDEAEHRDNDRCKQGVCETWFSPSSKTLV